jgi:serine/threonine-protein kinase
MSADHHSSDDDRARPRLSDPTTVDSTSPFDSTDRDVDIVPAANRTQLTSDPPTTLVRRESFHELPPGSVVDDTYEIDARLGAGAMGEVYAARHIKLGKRVAIKVISQRLSEDDAAIERFAMEARTLAQIQHPAIVAVEHIGELSDGRAYFVMELLRGESLFERRQRGRIPLPEALRILDQMARGLDAAHGEGVTHRDLKPENTFLVHLPGEPPTIKLLDFGLAKLAAERADVDRRAERTQSGVAIGTPMYMSPEQMRGPDVDHRTDIYALGCVAYELVLGLPPFPHAKAAPELYAAHLHESPPLPRSIWPEIPPQLDLALFAMVAKDPAHRPTLAQVRAVIADTRTATRSQRAATEFVVPRAAKQPRRTLAIGAVVLVALVGGITIGAAVGKHPGEAHLAAPTDPIVPRQHASPPITPQSAPPVAPPAAPSGDAPVTTDLKPTPPPRNVGAPRPSTARQLSKTGSAASAPVAPIDAGVDAPVEESPIPQPSPQPDKTTPKTKPVDRNQTINPFAKKRSKVNP